ncbi:hypothetical protein M885DRAFT_463980 [Pelagophyceae sp. CCMP2097]|nr:hypothetical protein M885DRAFT_463980 [Pelagophyceae sp. CCMP2097]
MHLSHAKHLDSVLVYRESKVRRVAIFAFFGLLYACGVTMCYTSAGRPYERALQQGKLLDADAPGAETKELLRVKAAAHAANAQRLKAQKLATNMLERRGDEDAEGGVVVDGETAPKKQTKQAAARAKAEVTLAYAADLAAFSIAAANRGENKTEDELRVELWGEDRADEIQDALHAGTEEEERPLPSKYLPNALACLVLFAAMSLHALFHLMCHWVVKFKAFALYDEVHGELNNRCTVLVQPCKHKGRPALVPVQSSKVGCGLVVEYQRELYEYWGPDDDGNGGVPGSRDADDAEDDDDDMFKLEKAPAAAVAEESDSESDDGGDDVVVVDERTQLVGKGGENGSLRRISPPVAFNLEYYTRAKGLDQRAIFASQGRYGKNVVEVRIPTFLALYKEQLLSPISMFQVFTSLLWILDAYWQYVGFTLFSIIVMEAGTVMQRQKTLKSLSGMSAKSAPVFCFRDGKWTEVDSEELLPGDLISLSRATRKANEPEKPEEEGKEEGKMEDEPKAPKKKVPKMVHVVPCDCLVVRGGAVCNEATLTGESTPQMKDAIVADDGRALDVQGRDRVAVLFSGTELVNANDDLRNINDKDPDHVPPAPDGGCVAFVLRTGFSSSQGELVQMIEFSQQQVSSDTRETLGALFVLLLFAIVSAAYVLKAGLAKGDRTTHELVLRCVIIVTSVVPRQLPMQMALAVNTALMALMKAGIMAVEPYRVPFAGRVEHCLFDKTGTLTTDKLVPVGVVCDSASTGVVKEFPMRGASAAAAVVIAACHSLVSAGTAEDGEPEELVGDPIELTAIRALSWKYDAKTSTATPPTGLVSAKKGDKPKAAVAKPAVPHAVISAVPASVKIVQRHHFSSALQRMSAVAEVEARDGSKTLVSLVKGSPEAIAGLLKPGTEPAWLLPTYNSLSERGMRVLALACKAVDRPPDKGGKACANWARGEVESDLIFCGLIAFECKTRADSAIVIQSLQESAHRVAMVTGDAPLTALHVARETHIAFQDQEDALVLNAEGKEWVSPYTPPRREAVPYDALVVPQKCALVVTEAAIVAATGSSADSAADADDAAWEVLSRSACVFARMSPQGKAKICRALQRKEGTHVLMCGDGGNDVGALKQADVGLALLAGYGDANTTSTGGYADLATKLAAAASAGRKASPEAILNAQAEALSEMHSSSVEVRKAKMAAKQKDLMSMQKVWIDEELAKRAARGETGMGSQLGAVKAVALRLRKEMTAEVEKLNAAHGSVYDSKKQDAAQQLEDLLGGAGAGEDALLPMIRPGDASVAAPFTSRAPSIRAVVDLVRQGRCTLLSSLQQQQIMVLESVISAYTLAALSLEGARSSERQMMASGWLLVIASMAFSYTKPIDKMADVRPISSLFDRSIVVSVAGQGLIHILCMRTAVKMATERMGPAALKAVVLFQKRARAGELSGTVDGGEDDDVMAWFSNMWSTPFLPNLLNTAVWLVETSQMVAVLLVNYKGRPWMRGLLENHALFLSLFISVAGVVVCAWGFVPMVNEAIHLAPFPDDAFRWKIVTLVMSSTAGTFVWDRLATYFFAPKIFNAMLREAKTTTLADVRPVAVTALKVAAGVALLAQGNLIMLGLAFYFYRNYNRKVAEGEKKKRDAIIAGAQEPAAAVAAAVAN